MNANTCYMKKNLIHSKNQINHPWLTFREWWSLQADEVFGSSWWNKTADRLRHLFWLQLHQNLGKVFQN